MSDNEWVNEDPEDGGLPKKKKGSGWKKRLTGGAAKPAAATAAGGGGFEKMGARQCSFSPGPSLALLV